MNVPVCGAAWVRMCFEIRERPHGVAADPEGLVLPLDTIRGKFHPRLSLIT